MRSERAPWFIARDPASRELDKYKAKRPVVIACKMGQHAGAAGTVLRKQGFEQRQPVVTAVCMAEWRNQNLPVVQS